MEDFRRASPSSSPFGVAMTGGGAVEFGAPKFGGGFSAEQPIIFGSGAAANHISNSSNANASGAAAPKRGRERPRSASPMSRPPIPPSHFAAYHQDGASKPFGKSPDQQREEEAAKARRLLRFGAEFGTRVKAVARPASMNDEEEASIPIIPAAGATLETAGRGFMTGQSKFRDYTPQAARNDTTVVEAVMVDMDAPDNLTSEPILGICPDMCPESERQERERKGDLDRFERVGGNRNQTDRDLAVKKYTRTAEKDAVLIRPLPVLKKTMGHLLSLLERDHEEDLLVVHSFLWDRMRAVRMDLRMQHIFTEDAIAMHEQMIRFHILAMHELCEFSEGEGISEVFNAHLNIEQMNKTSVDLFQMYDDHLKGGILVPSEAEFRGYYALLKLDKHPGYNVEPAELSLDLAKMTPDIRNSQEVRFARDVARACRAGNFVAFFRLAREATYLQACLMHAHFSKLRTQALASLHSGLQKNQGIPLSTAVDWLGMEGEDIDALIKYHGFTIKHYEEAYMVKEGLFLNKSKDFPTYRAQLVEAKRSRLIVMDVQAGKDLDTILQTPVELKRVSTMERKGKVRMGSMERKGPLGSEEAPALSSLEPLLQTKEEDMPDYIEEQQEEGEIEVEDVMVPPLADIVKIVAEDEGKQGKKRRMDEPQFEAEEHERRRLRHEADAVARRAASQAAAAEIKKKEEQRIRAGHAAEAFIGKQGTWFRKWRRRTAAKALERHRKQLETEAALDTLSLGFPLWKLRVRGAAVSLAERTEYTKTLVEEQGLKLQQMWEPLDIPNIVGPILQELNPGTHSLTWRLVLSTPSSPSGQWVRTKVGSRRKSGTGQDFTSHAGSNISIAEESYVLSGNQPGSIVDFQYSANDLGAAEGGLHSEVLLLGACGLLFVVNENEGVLEGHARLHALVRALPEGVHVPLLVLASSSRFADASEVDQPLEQEIWRPLKLGELSTARVSSSRVVSIAESSVARPGTNVFFSDSGLKEGIIWLAKLCPIQRNLRSLPVADLVREHLDTGLDHLLGMPFSDVNPECCINLFNQGIRDTAEEIASSASSFSAGSLPISSINEKRFTSEEDAGFRQMQRWNSKEALEALYANLRYCVLPPFPPFKPARNLGSINLQKAGFEEILLQFLNRVEGTNSDNLAVKWEVTRLVQRGCTVEWSELGLKLVPKWAEIFQAIFSARLLLLSIKPWPLVYIARMNVHKNETDTSKMKPGAGFSADGQLLLDDIIGGELQRPVSMQSEFVSPSEEKVPEGRSSRPQFTNGSGGSHGVQSRRQSMGACTERTLPKPISTLKKYMGYGLPEDAPLEWLVERDEESQAKRLRLAFTESESSLDKMLAEVRRQRHIAAEDLRAQNVDRLHASSDLLPVNVNNAEMEHHVCLHIYGRAETNRGEGEGSFREPNEVSSQNFLLELSPFEELLDRMVEKSSSKGVNGSERYRMGMVTPSRRLHSEIEEYRAKYQQLQSTNWSM